MSTAAITPQEAQTENDIQTEINTLQLLRDLARLRWLEVDSSSVAAVACSRDSEVLYVQMRGRAERIYAYADVPQSEFVELTTAPSIGSHFARNVRNAYPAERIEFAVQEVATR